MIGLPFFIAVGLILIGLFMIIAEVRACEYERNNLGGWVILAGVLLLVAIAFELAARYF